MMILTIESASSVRSVALFSEDGFMLSSADAPSKRDAPLASLIRKVLTKSKTSSADVSKIAVGVGPGSASGIRSTLAFAIGWKVAKGIEVMGISSGWTLATEARLRGIRGEVAVLFSGPMGKIYYNSFRLNASSIQEMQPLILLSVSSFIASKKANERAVGEGARMLKTQFAKHLSKPFPEQCKQKNASYEDASLLPTARALGILMAEKIKPAQCPLETLNLIPPAFVKNSD